MLAGCAGEVPPIASGTALAPAQAALRNCHEFTAQVTVEGQARQAVGLTCQQPDGGRQVTLNTPGLPQQVYTLPPEVIQLYAYPGPFYWWGPWFYGPLFVGGPVILTNGHRFHRHDFHHNGGSPNGGSHHGGSHGGRR